MKHAIFFCTPADLPALEELIDLPALLEETLVHTVAGISGDQIIESLRQNKMQLWLVAPHRVEPLSIKAICVTEIRQYPRWKALNVVGLVGDKMSEWQDAMDESLMHFAKEQKCERIECYVRKGLVRKLAPLGYRQMAVVLGKWIDASSHEDGLGYRHRTQAVR